MFVFGLSSFLIILSQLNLGWAATDYCSLPSCANKGTHTMCLEPRTGPGPDCKNYVKDPLKQSEITAIVNQHNAWRMKVASGLERRGSPGPQPPARSMPSLKWDNELATIAQRYADRCPVMGHDKCRDVATSAVGQNINTMWSRAPRTVNPTVVELMQAWYDEVALFNRNHVSKFVFSMNTGHYTQLVWGKTTHVGCGRSRFTANGQNYIKLICNYKPAGNFQNQPVYE